MNPLVLLGLGALVVLALGRKKKVVEEPSAPPEISEEQTFCEMEGGTYQEGLCVFPDGSTVEAGAFMRGEAVPQLPGSAPPTTVPGESILGEPSVFEPHPCEGGLPGPFVLHTHVENEWMPTGQQLDPAEPFERPWCVLPRETGYVARVVHPATGEVIWDSNPMESPDVAASQAWMVSVNPSKPYPWKGDYGLVGVGKRKRVHRGGHSR
jgi:hypothetical protein